MPYHPPSPRTSLNASQGHQSGRPTGVGHSTFNTQGHQIGQPTGARTLTRGLRGSTGTRTNAPCRGVGSEEGSSDAQMEVTANQINRVIRENKYRPLSVYDRDVFDIVKARMWWELGLFQDAFPEHGRASEFMVKIWAEAISELGDDYTHAGKATEAKDIFVPTNSNIPYKVSVPLLVLF